MVGGAIVGGARRHAWCLTVYVVHNPILYIDEKPCEEGRGGGGEGSTYPHMAGAPPPNEITFLHCGISY